MRQLKGGMSVQFRSGGNSLYPAVHSGDCCLYESVSNCDFLDVDDIVFCKVQPNDRYYAHKILRIKWVAATSSSSTAVSARRFFTIDKSSGHVNGWCYDEGLFGRLVEVLK